MIDPSEAAGPRPCCMLWDSHGQHAPTCQHYSPPSAPSDPSGAAKRLAAYVERASEMKHSRARHSAYYTVSAHERPQEMAFLADLRAVLAELSRLREERDAAHRDGWASAMETVTDERRREREDVVRLEAEVTRLHDGMLRQTKLNTQAIERAIAVEARLDAVLRLCDEAEQFMADEGCGCPRLLRDIRAVLSSTGEPEAEAAPWSDVVTCPTCGRSAWRATGPTFRPRRPWRRHAYWKCTWCGYRWPAATAAPCGGAP